MLILHGLSIFEVETTLLSMILICANAQESTKSEFLLRETSAMTENGHSKNKNKNNPKTIPKIKLINETQTSLPNSPHVN